MLVVAEELAAAAGVGKGGRANPPEFGSARPLFGRDSDEPGTNELYEDMMMTERMRYARS